MFVKVKRDELRALWVGEVLWNVGLKGVELGRYSGQLRWYISIEGCTRARYFA